MVARADGSGGAAVPHPPGVRLLCAAEALERFSYYTMSGLLALFLTGGPGTGGFGWAPESAIRFAGTYTAIVWFAPLLGGWIADRLLGARRAVVWGGVLLAAGQALMAAPVVMPILVEAATGQAVAHAIAEWHGPLGRLWLVPADRALLSAHATYAPMTYWLSTWPFYTGLAVLALGNGLFKPNVTVLLGRLYGPDHPRRDDGFTLFYIAINVGGILSALAAGTIGELFGWAFGFGVAALAMVAGTLLVIASRRYFSREIDRPSRTISVAPSIGADRNRPTSGRIAFIALMAAFATLFWAAYLQIYGLLALFTYTSVNRTIAGFTIPAPWFGSLPSVYVILVGTSVAAVFRRRQNAGRRIDTVGRFVLGLCFAAGAFALLAGGIGSSRAGGGTGSAWLLAFYLLLTLGELCLSPAGNEMAARFAPPHLSGRLMAVWMLCLAFGSLLAGWVGSLGSPTMPVPVLAGLAAALAGSGGALALLRHRLRGMVASAS